MSVRKALTAVALLSLFAVSTAWAQAPLAGPDEVVIHLHSSLHDTDFAEGLVCELGRVLRVPVSATASDLPLTGDLLATPTQIDADRLAHRFVQAVSDRPGRPFSYLIVPHDLKAVGLNYVFSSTRPDIGPVAVMSTIRLMPRDAGLTRKRAADVTGDRLYKLMLKSIAVLAGLRSTGCIMAFPRSLPELDAKSAEFCPDDRRALVAAGILKARPVGACNIVAMAER
jgi:predicted Zn-dependent protease